MYATLFVGSFCHSTASAACLFLLVRFKGIGRVDHYFCWMRFWLVFQCLIVQQFCYSVVLFFSSQVGAFTPCLCGEVGCNHALALDLWIEVTEKFCSHLPPTEDWSNEWFCRQFNYQCFGCFYRWSNFSMLYQNLSWKYYYYHLWDWTWCRSVKKMCWTQTTSSHLVNRSQKSVYCYCLRVIQLIMVACFGKHSFSLRWIFLFSWINSLAIMTAKSLVFQLTLRLFASTNTQSWFDLDFQHFLWS